MKNTRTKNVFLSIAYSITRHILGIVLAFVSRTVFIYCLGAEYLGLNGLFSNILSLLSLSELGIGVTISYYLYRPLVDNDFRRIAMLMNFYKVCYRIVGIVIIGIGCCLMPFLRHLVNFDQDVPENLYVIFFLYLLNSASTYLFLAYKQALVTANQEQYKIEKVNIVFTVINCLSDIIILILFRKYIIYLISKIVLVIVKNYVISRKIDEEYSYINDYKDESISKSEIKNFFHGVLSITVFRLGAVLLNSTDNIIISIYLGTLAVGYYSNYFLIISQITTAMGLVVNSLTAGIGNVVARENLEKVYKIYKKLDFYMYLFAVFCTICLFQLSNSFVKVWLGNISQKYILSQYFVFFLSLTLYYNITTQISNAFRTACGCFSIGQWLPLIGGIVNIVLSSVFAKHFGIEGVIAATVISKAFITVIPFTESVSINIFHNKRFSYAISYHIKHCLKNKSCTNDSCMVS